MNEAWDCDLFFVPPKENFDLDIDLEDSTGDWQVLALDRFGDRYVSRLYGG